mmetsp:Transcript_104530/g.207593  ORF Transcript_104530/g.207593 Transcript_104530/m.207593 type:complete len:101 (-) Transcript_104530:406-708(-)
MTMFAHFKTNHAPTTGPLWNRRKSPAKHLSPWIMATSQLQTLENVALVNIQPVLHPHPHSAPAAMSSFHSANGIRCLWVVAASEGHLSPLLNLTPVLPEL